MSTRSLTVFVAMSLVGVSVGLKWTNGPWAVACILGLILAIPGTDKWRSGLIAIAGVVSGFLVAYGPWAVVMYENYRSPVFPLFNGIFHSADYLPVDFRDTRWTLRSPIDLITLPFTWLTTSRRTSEAAMRDWRWFALLVLAVIWFIQRLFLALDFRRRPRGSAGGSESSSTTASPSHAEPGAARFIITLVLAGYVLSMWQLAYTRYLVIGELFAGLAFLFLLEKVWSWRGITCG